MGDSLRYKDWFEKAAHDLRGAEILMEHDGGNDLVAFHCQQAMEKMLKGWLLKTTGELLDGHSLVFLCRKATAAGAPLSGQFSVWVSAGCRRSRSPWRPRSGSCHFSFGYLPYHLTSVQLRPVLQAQHICSWSSSCLTALRSFSSRRFLIQASSTGRRIGTAQSDTVSNSLLLRCLRSCLFSAWSRFRSFSR